MTLLIKTDGKEVEVHPKRGKKFVLKELQQFVDGWIEMIKLPDNREMYMNEEAKLHPRFTYNSKATKLAREAGLSENDEIRGDVLITGPNATDV